MIQHLVETVQQLDPDGVLAPYLEANAAEFAFAPPPAPTDEWVVDNRAAAGLKPGTDKDLLACARHVPEEEARRFL